MTDKTPVDRIVDLLVFHVETGITLRDTATKIAEAIQDEPLHYVKVSPCLPDNRVTTCLNAFVGIDDPEAFMRDAVEHAILNAGDSHAKWVCARNKVRKHLKGRQNMNRTDAIPKESEK